MMLLYMDKLQFKLEMFEGPLDLLLHLISKHKLDIYDIEISKLLEQYLNYINEMEALNLELASGFLEMAARLVYIKTVSLLPRHEEADELKTELTGQLLELSAIKFVTSMLEKERGEGLKFVRQQLPMQLDRSYNIYHDPEELISAYVMLSIKAKQKLPPPKSAFSGIVEKKVVSVTSKIIFVLKKLYKNGKVSYQEFFRTDHKSELVATFLAMLELIKSKRIYISQDNKYVHFNRSSKDKL